MERTLSPLTNATSILPSPADLLLAVPRLLFKVGSLSDHIDNMLDRIRSGGGIIAEPTALNASNSTIATTAGQFVQASGVTPAGATLGGGDDVGIYQALRNVSSFFTYMTSKWAIATFTIGILLNRTHFYASSRVPLSFDRLHLRLALYLAPLLLFLWKIQTVLRAIRCQTDPSWSSRQYGGSGRQLDTDFGGEGGFLWSLSSALLLFENVEDSCRANNMLPIDPSATRPSGSLALLWPLFISLGFGQFMETMACALQGRQPVQEVGMTIFEHSLAFAEAEAVVTRPITLNATRFYRSTNITSLDGTALTLSRSALSAFANVPTEVLLISLISSLSHFTSNFLAVVGYRARFRLVTTGIWGLAYMATFAWSFFRFVTLVGEPGQQLGLLRFPTVCIVGFVPHLLMLVGIAACSLIYLVAFAFTVLSPPPGLPPSLTWRGRFSVAYNNLHANIHLSAITPITVSWSEDFYTAILKIGFTVLTAASEAVYLNEGIAVNVHSLTWIEKKKLQSILARRRQFQQSLNSVPAELRESAFVERVASANEPHADEWHSPSSGGYAQERNTRGPTSAMSKKTSRDNGVGVHHRRSRWMLTYQFLRGIVLLLLTVQARLLIGILHKLRITSLPRWLTQLAGPRIPVKSPSSTSDAAENQPRTLSNPWFDADEQILVRPNASFDVEAFARHKLREDGAYEEQGPEHAEEHLSEYLYNWWKGGGKWGDTDTSGDYVPTQDDDTTSLISFASTTDDRDAWSDVEDDGQRTPTQHTYQGSQDSTPELENALDLSRLSHLLDPKTREDREAAKLLSRHLQSDNVLTRSQYRKTLDRDEAQLFATSRFPLAGSSAAAFMTPEEEEDLLGEFIVDKRRAGATPRRADAAGSWDSGAEGMGSEGPQCVVCQLSPRTVLVWPCGCLSLCDDCRVGLASKNYTNCVCCRTSVVAYSRLFVP